MNVWEENRYPWLVKEKLFIKNWVLNLEKPFFGICFGLLLIVIQKNLPILYVPSTSLAYPVEIEFENCLLVLSTVFTLGSITSVIATAGIKKKAYLHLS